MKRRTRGERIFNVFNIIFMLMLCIVILFPYVNVLAVSLNDSTKAVPSGLMLVPKVFSLANYSALLSNDSIWRALFVTIGRIAVGVCLQLLVTFFCAYGMTRKQLPYRRAISLFLFIPSYISGGLIPLYILYVKIGLLNNPLVYVLPTAFSFFNFILCRTYISSIPDSLDESARLDGAGEMTVMLRIYLPLSLPIIATIALFNIVGHWNDWTTTLYFMTNNKWNTLAFELQRVLNEQSRLTALLQEAIKNGQIAIQSPSTSEGLRNAQIIVTSLPIILIYPFLQKYFIKGMLIGGVKE